MSFRVFSLPSILRVLLVLLVVPAALLARAQAPEDAREVSAIEREIDALKREIEVARTTEQRVPLLEKARGTHEQAVALQASLSAPLAQVKQRIEQLGPDAARSADPAVRQQYLELSRELAAKVALTRRTALAEVEALQSVNTVNAQHARAISEELFQRTASPLTPSLWIDGIASLRTDLSRGQVAARPANMPAQPMPLVLFALAAWAGLLWVMLVPGRRLLDRLGTRLADRLAGREAHFALSLFAVWSVLIGVLNPTTSAWILLAVMHWSGLPTLWVDLVAPVIVAAVIGFFVRATVLAILQPASRMWRLWKVSDAAAWLGARAGNALASSIVLIIAVEAAINRLALTPATQVFLHSALALVSVAQIGYALFVLGRIRRLEDIAERAEEQATRGRITLLVGLGWLGLATLALSGMLGYVSLANRLSQWAIWGCVVVLTTYVLMAFVDGLCKLLASTRTRTRQGAPASRALQQAAVLLSAICRLLLLFLACGALLVPFGAGFTSVLELLGALAKGFEVGGITISVAAVLRALLAFAVVIALIRFVRSWISDSYLPTTGLQPDARESIDKILRYAGIVLAVLWALTAFGVGMDKVAILASALSVGIGFGLQAITQNFVSGLILLVERPVKIGDWVKLNDVEGDIRRINVRSTEIRVGDHSTMIVPNSELITKVVQNMTKGNAIGRAQLLLTIPLESDLNKAIEVVLAVLSDDEEVLETPAPAVFIDKIENGMAVLNCFAHVRTARAAYGVRSRMILAALRSLKTHDIPVSLPPQQFVIAPALPA